MFKLFKQRLLLGGGQSRGAGAVQTAGLFVGEGGVDGVCQGARGQPGRECGGGVVGDEPVLVGR